MNYFQKTVLTLLGTLTLAAASASASSGAEAAAVAGIGVESIGAPSTHTAPAPKQPKGKHHPGTYSHDIVNDMMPRGAVADKIFDSPEPLKLSSPRRHSRRLTGRYKREGIDVSHYQREIDWEAVASHENISYAYIKCSEGSSLKDDYYICNVEGARKAGIFVGAYHFYRPDVSPKEQLRNMSEIAKAKDFDLVPMIDVEVRGYMSQERFIADLKEFTRLVEQHYDCKPLFYTGQNFYNRYLIGEFKGYNWMMAKYSEEEPILLDNQYYTFWQYTSKGRIKGIKGNVDRSCLMEGFSLGDVEY